jgi:hypothetical protein
MDASRTVRPEWSDDRTRIDTIVTLEAASYLKGGPGDAVTFRVPGGQIGRYRNVMVGAPEFRQGEEVVLFLRAAGPSVAHRVRTESGCLSRARRRSAPDAVS